MASRKTTIVVPQPKPRNPVRVPALKRRAGAHGKSYKAVRQQVRQRTQQCLPELLDGDKAEFEVD